MIDRRDVLRYIPVVVIAVTVIGVSAGIVTSFDAEEMRHTVEMAEAYCYQVHGEADVYNAMVVGDHGGLHCIANTDANGGDKAHLHQVPWEYVERAYQANQTGRQITFKHTEVADPCKPFWCSNTDILPMLLGVLALSVVIVGVLGLFGRGSE